MLNYGMLNDCTNTIAKSCFEDEFVPTEHQEITLMEFKTTIADEILSNKSRRRSEKITPFKV